MSDNTTKRKRPQTLTGPGVHVVFENNANFFITTGDDQRCSVAIFAPNVTKACFSSVNAAARYIMDRTPDNLELRADLLAKLHEKYQQVDILPTPPFEKLRELTFAQWMGDLSLSLELTRQKGVAVDSYLAKQNARQNRAKSKKAKRNTDVVIDGQKSYVLYARGNRLVEQEAHKALHSAQSYGSKVKQQLIGYMPAGILLMGVMADTEQSSESVRKDINTVATAIVRQTDSEGAYADKSFFGNVFVLTTKKFIVSMNE